MGQRGWLTAAGVAELVEAVDNHEERMTLGEFIKFAERYLEGGAEQGAQLIDQVRAPPPPLAPSLCVVGGGAPWRHRCWRARLALRHACGGQGEGGSNVRAPGGEQAFMPRISEGEVRVLMIGDTPVGKP